MDAEAADRSRVEPNGPLRTAVLTGAAVAAVVVGGWSWAAGAPNTGPVPAAGSPQVSLRYGPGELAQSARLRLDAGSDAPLVVDPDTGSVFRVDPVTGAAIRIGRDPGAGAGTEPSTGDVARPGRLDRFPGTVWRERTTLTPERGLTRQSQAEDDARHLLQFRCTGPGELLVVVEGAWSAAPLTSGCQGAVTTMEVVGAGRPVRVTLSTAGAEPVQVQAQLVALP